MNHLELQQAAECLAGPRGHVATDMRYRTVGGVGRRAEYWALITTEDCAWAEATAATAEDCLYQLAWTLSTEFGIPIPDMVEGLLSKPRVPEALAAA